MKRLLNILILLSLLTAGGCDQSDDAEPEFITVEVSPIHSNKEGIFVFVTDNNGGILDGKTVRAGSSVKLRTVSSPDKGNLTICYTPDLAPSFYTITGLQAGEKIRIDDSSIINQLPPVTGTAFINVQNCDDEFLTLADGVGYTQAASIGTNSIEAAVALRKPSSRVLVSSYKAIDEPVYAWVDNVVNQGTYSLDYNTFTPFPKTITISFDEYVSAYITGRNSGDTGFGYVMMDRGFARNAQDPSVAKFGYFDGFDQYTMSVFSITNTDDYYHPVHIYRVGPGLPEEIIVPDNTLSIENASISDFRFTYSSTFTFSIHQWMQQTPSQNFFFWTIYSDNATIPPIKKLPRELAEKYPFISFDDLKHLKSEFRTSEDDYSYRQFIGDAFDTNDNSGRSYFMETFQIR